MKTIAKKTSLPSLNGHNRQNLINAFLRKDSWKTLSGKLLSSVQATWDKPSQKGWPGRRCYLPLTLQSLAENRDSSLTWTKWDLPPQLIDRLTANLFCVSDDLHPVVHPYDSVGTALLGASTKMKIGPAGAEFELDGKGIKRLQKATEAKK